MSDLEARVAALPDKSLLLLDDDQALRTRMGRALEARGFQVTTAESVAEATQLLRDKAPAFAVREMRLEDGNGLKIVEAVREKREDARIVMLTGYGAIATAVAAVKAGAVDYLSKPADANDVTQALLAKGAALGTVLAFMMSVIALSAPEMIILRKALKPRLIATFAGVVALGILLVGYVFNLVL